MAAYIRAQPSAPLLLPLGLLQDRMIPRQKLGDTALPVSVHDGGECSGQIGQRINRIELARLDERGDGGPVLCSGIMTSKECVLPLMQIFA